MEVKVVRGGDAAFNSMVYKTPSNEFLDYLQTGIERVSARLGDMGTNFMNNARAIYDSHNSDAVLNASRAMLMNIDSHLNDDAIYTITRRTLPEANTMMQKYIIANPTVNKLHQKNMCNGFEGTYLNIEPDNVGVERYDYKRVMDGINTTVNDVDCIQYHSFDDYENNELHAYEKISVLDTWHNVEQMIFADVDPTDLDLGDL